ncbi:Na+/H+ antiporter NhaA [Amycolatopsis sp. NPDC005961]|uniref:Na+/H+ antiporter NhaA n=1 Tax=Amycolatopsis sp. NPDC005961 TaxID=3156720 RepID=UPI0033F10D28
MSQVSDSAGQTAWRHAVSRRVRRFAESEAGGAVALLACAALALLWANLGPGTYEAVWRTPLSVSWDGHGIDLSLREWVNSGLMAFFFFVVGLEARREFDLGELRDRSRLILPLAAGLAGMAVPALVYLLVTAGGPAARGWGAAISTDTALALGLLALSGVGSKPLRSFLLAILVVDDIVALVVIAVAYTDRLRVTALLFVVAVVVVLVVVRTAGVRNGVVYFVIGIAGWIGLLESGIDPVTAGLVLGLLTWAYPAARTDLEEAIGLVRAFREQPTADLARSARLGLRSAISPNDRMLRQFSRWVTYVVVPLFALANVGVTVTPELLAKTVTSPIVLGIVLGYVAGKPLGVLGMSAVVTFVSRGRLRPPVGWVAVAGLGAIAGVGFTVTLLIATLAFRGPELDEAKLGVLSAAVLAFAISRLVFAVGSRLGSRALLGTAPALIDLTDPVDPGRDHVRGPADAPVTVVEYGDFQCEFCGRAEGAVRELLAERADVRYVWRHLPLAEVHPQALLAAYAAEAAGRQGAFWAMHDLLLAHQDDLTFPALVGYAGEAGLDVERFRGDLAQRHGQDVIAEHIDSADRSSVSGTPTFFVNGRRHHGAYDIAALTAEVDVALARVATEVTTRAGRSGRRR